MKRRTKIILFLIAVIAAVAIYFLSEYNRQHEHISSMEPVATTTAGELIKAFESDSAKASSKYVDQIILVQGQLSAIDSTGVLTLGVDGEMSTVQCTMDTRNQVTASLKEGMQVSIKGKCSGFETQELLGQISK